MRWYRSTRLVGKTKENYNWCYNDYYWLVSYIEMKILIIKQNLNDVAIDTLLKGISLTQQKASTIGLSLNFDYTVSTKIFTSVPVVNNIILNGHIVNPPEIFQEALKSNIPFDVCLLVFDSSKISPMPTNPDDAGKVIQIPQQWFNNSPEVFASFLLHELCHYFFQSKGLPDKTHDKYSPTWNGQFSQASDIDYYLFLLKPLVGGSTEPISAPSVVLTRNIDNGAGTMGTLQVGDKFSCKTLELSWRFNQQNISCIPKGQYVCKWKFMLRDLAYHYQLQNVQGRSGIFIHSGNYYYDSKGCIILGSLPKDLNGDLKLDLQNSKSILASFEAMMNKQDFTLTIQ